MILGNANGASEENRNVARMAWLLAAFPDTVSGITVNRLCASGLSAIIMDEVHLYALAPATLAALMERGKHGDGGAESGYDTEDRHAGAIRGGLRTSGKAHEPGHCLDQQVVAGQGSSSGRAESRD
ncbi:acetyl-CoA acetyltransferase [Arthrobacter oryzae]|nr:acetyl-CoA acetyltransferase [Arthrobacter oryzae]